MMTEFYDLRVRANATASYVEGELGGKVILLEDKEGKTIVLDWKKYDVKTNTVLRFSYKISYEDLEGLQHPSNLGQIIVKKYRKKEKHGPSGTKFTRS
jgi:hypothetical protein